MSVTVSVRSFLSPLRQGGGHGADSPAHIHPLNGSPVGAFLEVLVGVLGFEFGKGLVLRSGFKSLGIVFFQEESNSLGNRLLNIFFFILNRVLLNRVLLYFMW